VPGLRPSGAAATASGDRRGAYSVSVTSLGDPGRSGVQARTARMLRLQADACRQLGSPLYGDLLLRAAHDLQADGPLAEVLDGFLDDQLKSALALRLLGGVHAIVLSGRAPALAAFYPSVGGTPEHRRGSPRAWAEFRRVITDYGAEIRSWLDHPPQTNEVGRAAALLGGLRHIAAEASLPIRLVEVGASAGLNLRADRFCVPGHAGSYGDRHSPVVLAGGWLGHAPPESQIEVVERTGGDLAPINPLTEDGRLTLTAYIWPDQADRLARLRGALTIAAQVPAELRAESAPATLVRTRLEHGTWTVLWHSIFRQYLDDSERAELATRVAELGASATPQTRFAYVYLEPSRAGGCRVTLTTWPGGLRRVLGSAPAHGLPVHWHTAT
jgi:hypothetical protein